MYSVLPDLQDFPVFPTHSTIVLPLNWDSPLFICCCTNCLGQLFICSLHQLTVHFAIDYWLSQNLQLKWQQLTHGHSKMNLQWFPELPLTTETTLCCYVNSTTRKHNEIHVWAFAIAYTIHVAMPIQSVHHDHDFYNCLTNNSIDNGTHTAAYTIYVEFPTAIELLRVVEPPNPTDLPTFIHTSLH